MPYQIDWFSRNIPYWQQYLARFKDKPNLTFLELGCFEGKTTTWLLKNILTDPTSKIIVVDTFEGSPEFIGTFIDNTKIEPNFRENIKGYENKVEIWKGKTEMIKNADPSQFDCIYIDASHCAVDVLRDAVMSFDLLKSGGSIIFDDYGWGEGNIERERPYKAIQACIEIWGGFYGDWQFWLDQAAFTKR